MQHPIIDEYKTAVENMTDEEVEEEFNRTMKSRATFAQTRKAATDPQTSPDRSKDR